MTQYHQYNDSDVMDAAVDRKVSEQVRDINFDAIKSIREKSKRPDN